MPLKIQDYRLRGNGEIGINQRFLNGTFVNILMELTTSRAWKRPLVRPVKIAMFQGKREFSVRPIGATNGRVAGHVKMHIAL